MSEDTSRRMSKTPDDGGQPRKKQSHKAAFKAFSNSSRSISSSREPLQSFPKKNVSSPMPILDEKDVEAKLVESDGEDETQSGGTALSRGYQGSSVVPTSRPTSLSSSSAGNDKADSPGISGALGDVVEAAISRVVSRADSDETKCPPLGDMLLSQDLNANLTPMGKRTSVVIGEKAYNSSRSHAIAGLRRISTAISLSQRVDFDSELELEGRGVGGGGSRAITPRPMSPRSCIEGLAVKQSRRSVKVQRWKGEAAGAGAGSGFAFTSHPGAESSFAENASGGGGGGGRGSWGWGAGGGGGGGGEASFSRVAYSTRSVRGARDAVRRKVPMETQVFCRDLLRCLRWANALSPYRPALRRRLRPLLARGAVQALLMFLLMTSLLLKEIWTASNAAESLDVVLNSILITIFLIFMVECIVLSMSEEGYFRGFFFWTDVLGSASILLDITWIYSESYNGATTVLRASRLSKMLRLTKVVKLLRLLKVLRLLRVLQFAFSHNDDDQDNNENKIPSRTKRLSNEIRESVGKRVALVVLALLLLLPLLVYTPVDLGPVVETANWDRLVSEGLCNHYSCFTQVVEAFAESYDGQDVYPREAVIDGVGNWSWATGYARSNNLAYYSLSTGGYLIMDETGLATTEAGYTLGSIFLAVTLLVGFGAAFQGRLDELVVRPLDRVIHALTSSAAEMLESAKALGGLDDEEAEEMEGDLETQLLEDVIRKMGDLVRRAAPDADAQRLHELLRAKGGADQPASRDTAVWLAQNFLRGSADGVERAVLAAAAPGGAGADGGRAARGGRPPRATKRRGRGSSIASALLFQLDEGGVDFPAFLENWEYNPLDYDRRQNFQMLHVIFQSCEVTQTLSIPDSTLQDFFEALAGKYLAENPYHTFEHGVDVCYYLYRLMRESHFNVMVPQLDLVVMLITAVAHDVGHLGVNNAFLVAAGHPLARLYNDQSPLENMHGATLFALLGEERTALLAGLGAESRRRARALAIRALLGTDMRHHFRAVSDLEAFYEAHRGEFERYRAATSLSASAGTRGGAGAEGVAAAAGSPPEPPPPPPCLDADERAFLLLGALLHLADVAGPLHPPPHALRWARRVAEEFYLQGDEERRLEMPVSPMMDRNNPNFPQMQLGFAEFVVAPLAIGITKIFPDLNKILVQLAENYQQFSYMKRDEIRKNRSLTDAQVAEELTKTAKSCATFEGQIGKFMESLVPSDFFLGKNISSGSQRTRRSF